MDSQLDFTTCIFDFDGILVESENLLVMIWEKAAREYGFNFTEADFYPGLGRSIDDYRKILLARFGEEFPFDAVYARVQIYFKSRIQCEGLPLVEGATELRQYLEEMHIKMAVASSTYRDEVLYRMQKTGLSGLFPVVLGGDDIQNAKPAPDIFLRAAELLESKPQDCLVLEDSENGILAAKNAGMRVFLVKNLSPVTAIMQEKADAIFSSHHELLQYLQMNGAALS